MSSLLNAGKEDKEEEAAAGASDWCWHHSPPSHPYHRQQVPSAITLHRLVLRPPPPLHQAANTTTTSTFKYITPEEIKAAQLRARQEILASKLVAPTPPPPSSPPLPPPPSFTPSLPSPGTKKQHHHSTDRPGLHPSFPCRLGGGESALRRRQLARLLSQILCTLGNLQDVKDPCQRDFVAPLDLEIKRRHWTECVRSLRRSLFALRQEVLILERGGGQGRRNSRHLRALAAAARTLNIQLMALKSQAESSSRDLAWTELHSEFLGVARRVLVLAGSVGVQPPSSSVKGTRLPEGLSVAPEDSKGFESVLSVSDTDSTNIYLQPRHVRDRLARLPVLHLRRKSQGGHERVTRSISASKDPTLDHQSLPSAPKTSFPAPQSFKINLKAAPQPSPKPANNSVLQPQPLPPQTNVSAPQPQSSPQTNVSDPQTQPSPSQSNTSAPQSQPWPPQTNTPAHPAPSPHNSSLPAPKSDNRLVPQASLLSPEFTQQLSLLLDRVCRIEDNQKRTEALVSEASKSCQTQDLAPSLRDAMQRARDAMATVRGTAPQSQRPLSKSGGSYSVGATLIRSTGLSLKAPEGALLGTSSSATGGHHRSEELRESASPLEAKWLTGESVTEQVRRQKERFWLSLAEQGFVRPPETVPLSEEEMQFIAQHGNQSVKSKGPLRSPLEKSLENTLAKTHKKTGVPIGSSSKKAASRGQSHQQTQTRFTTEHRQSSSLAGSSSDPLSPSTDKTRYSPSDSQVKPNMPAGSSNNQSVSSEGQHQESVSVDSNTVSRTANSTESQSFPSYEGIGN